VIAAVNGLAYGGGCEIVEATHLSIAITRSSVSKAEIAISPTDPDVRVKRIWLFIS